MTDMATPEADPNIQDCANFFSLFDDLKLSSATGVEELIAEFGFNECLCKC